MPLAGKYPQWEFGNWVERNYADWLAEVTTPSPPSSSHMASNSEGGDSVGNISGPLPQPDLRGYFNKFTVENIHRDRISAMAAEAEIAAPATAPTTAAATYSTLRILELLQQLNERDSIVKHSVENTFHSDLISAMPDTCAADYNDNSWGPSPIQEQYQQRFRQHVQKFEKKK